MHLFKTLKFQIGAALALIVLLFAGVFASSMMALEEQRDYNSLLNITARLEHTAQSLVSLGVNYAMNSPADDASYQRDLRLYYQEIRSQIELFDRITNGFMQGRFDPALTDRSTPFTLRLDPAVRAAVGAVEAAWAQFRGELEATLGMDEKGPQLDRAAAYIANNHQLLRKPIDALRAQIQRLVEERLDRVARIAWVSLTLVIALTFGILIWFYGTVLRPLNRTVAGFSKVAQGDFGLQVETWSDNELSSLTRSFNQLSSRLDAIFRLIDQIQQGSDLDDTLQFVARHFPALLPLDWVGALFVSADRKSIVLERSYREDHHEAVPPGRFRLQGTLLEKALEEDQPLHIPDMRQTAAGNPQYQFLNHLVAHGLRDAIFLPVTGQSPIPGVLAFATTQPGCYTPEHLELLSNIAKLITHSFGRTVRMVEHARLAAIGGFASSIAHEIRSPLSTIGMALDYLQQGELAPGAMKRAQLAQRETARLTRLLEEILLYAKPIRLETQTLDFTAFVEQFLSDHAGLAERRGQRFASRLPERDSPVSIDPDRMRQVLLNLAHNACEAAPDDSVIDWRLRIDTARQEVELAIVNGGQPIPPELLPRLFEPFFTTKSEGTGLGLGVVKRMVDAHGGQIALTSDSGQGTRATLRLPLCP